MSDTGQAFFTSEQLALLEPSLLPRHIAVIPDGNRRWAEKRLLSADVGHRPGADVVMDIVEAAKLLGIKMLTVFTFSTENWKRPPTEVEELLNLAESYLNDHRERMVKEGVKLGTIGELSRLPASLQETIAVTKAATEGGEGIDLILAINYGARDELQRTMKKILHETQRSNISLDEIDEHFIARRLDTASWGDPDLLIRTSGEMRLSNFLLWQLSYSEIYIADVLWPDFSPDHLFNAVLDYQARSRRHGR